MDRKKLLNIAIALSIITILYNIIEGVVSIYFGLDDSTLSLLGFGIDSFVEVMSGIGVAHMVLRMKVTNVDQHDLFERQALRITGLGFYILTSGIIIGAIFNLIAKNKPETTIPGLIISFISIITMFALMRYKLYIGKKLDSDAIIADANCTKSCFYLSIVLLLSSGLFEIFKIGYIDIIGSLVIAWFTFKEGREVFEKVRQNKISCNCNHCNN
jgi:divalent metal cation (Fe/Co/Zn/Cd) transporter